MEKPGKPLFLDSKEVEKNLPLGELINGIEQCFLNFSTKAVGVIQPPRMVIPVSEKNHFYVKPACSVPDKTLATKLLCLYPENEEKFGLPSHQAVVTIFDSETGKLQAVMDGVAITDLRTAAATAVAVKHLSKDDHKILAIIGTGHQAASHVKLLREIRQFDEIRVFSRNKERCEQFAKQWDVHASSSVEDAVKVADVVVTVTMSSTPVLYYEWVKPGALINIVGAPRADMRECDDGIMLNSQVIVDMTSESYANAGDIVLSKAKIHGELGDIISGNIKADWSKLRVFKSNGMALQDLVAGRIVVNNVLNSN